MFASTKVDRSALIEIKKENEPQLFQLIHEVVEKVGTHFPKKVFLDPNVNASVFYDSNFWSMFLPIRKNLLIGVGLINCVTYQELKAVLAHEFGHFSQRSMKVGSYVYNVNEIIYNMLYNNNSLNNLLEKWSNISGTAGIFVSISVFIIKQIQAILEKLYTYVNRNYLALSREMEFHADEIAAHVAGSKACADSLLRLPFANHALQNVLSFYQGKIKQNIRSQNFYPEQRFVMELLAKKYNCKEQDGFPLIEVEQLGRIYKSKLNIDNQWASHPSDEDRVKAHRNLNIVIGDTTNSPAIHLLSDATSISERLVVELFSDSFYTETPTAYSVADFQIQFSNLLSQNNLDERLNGYYDNHDIVVLDDSVIMSENMITKFEDLYSDARLEVVNELTVLKNDRLLLQAIQENEIVTKTFDYHDNKYSADQVGFVLQQVDERIAMVEKEIVSHDERVHQYFRHLAANQGQEMKFDEIWNNYSTTKAQVEKNITLFQELSSNSMFLFQIHSFQDIEARLSDLSRREPVLKQTLRDLLASPEIQEELEESEKNKLEKYINEDLTYFHVNTYHDDNLSLLMNAITQLENLSRRYLFLQKRTLLNFNLQLHENKVNQAAGYYS